MKVTVRIHPNHPGETRRRCGMEFTREKTEADVDEATFVRLCADGALEVSSEGLTPELEALSEEAPDVGAGFKPAQTPPTLPEGEGSKPKPSAKKPKK